MKDSLFKKTIIGCISIITVFIVSLFAQGYAFESIEASIVVDSIERISSPDSELVVGGTYEQGYHFRLRVSVPETEATLAFKLDDWTGGVGTMTISGNTLHAISSNGFSSFSSAEDSLIAVKNEYQEYQDITSINDANKDKDGKQLAIDIFYKIPEGAGGSYTTNYGISSQTSATALSEYIEGLDKEIEVQFSTDEFDPDTDIEDIDFTTDVVQTVEVQTLFGELTNLPSGISVKSVAGVELTGLSDDIDNVTAEIIKLMQAQGTTFGDINTKSITISMTLSYNGTEQSFNIVATFNTEGLSEEDVSSEEELNDALAKDSITKINIVDSFTLEDEIRIERNDIIIDGKNNTITGPQTGRIHGFTVLGDNIEISDLTIDGSSRSNIQFYETTGGKLTNVTLSNAANAGMIVNGSEVTIENVSTLNNTWGGINVDQGSGVTDIPKLTVVNATVHTSPSFGVTPALWLDKKDMTAWIEAEDFYEEVEVDTQRWYIDKDEFEGFDTASVTSEAELNLALSRSYIENINITSDFSLENEIRIEKDGVTINGSGSVITGPQALNGKSRNHGFTILADNVSISDLTVKDSINTNIQFYEATGGTLTDVTVENAGNAGIIVNGSEVSVENVSTINNTWGGINVDQGSGVTQTPKLTVVNVTIHTSPEAGITPALWLDKKDMTEWIEAEDFYEEAEVGTQRWYFDKEEFDLETLTTAIDGLTTSLTEDFDATTENIDIDSLDISTQIDEVFTQIEALGTGFGVDAIAGVTLTGDTDTDKAAVNVAIKALINAAITGTTKDLENLNGLSITVPVTATFGTATQNVDFTVTFDTSAVISSSSTTSTD